MLRQIPDAGRVFLCCLIAYPLPYYLVAVSTRYMVPLGWLILFLAVYGVAMLLPFIRRNGALREAAFSGA
jgi:hypothetical protein